MSEPRDLTGFDSVHVNNGLRLEPTVGSEQRHSVGVRYDDNVIDHVAPVYAAAG